MIFVLSFFSTSVSGKKNVFFSSPLGINYEIQNLKKLPLTISDLKMPLTSPFHLISRVFYLCVVY